MLTQEATRRRIIINNTTTTSLKQQQQHINRTTITSPPKHHHHSPSHRHHHHSPPPPPSPPPKAFLSTQQLHRFESNNCKRLNNSLLHYISQPYLKSLCQHIPPSFPPNLISIIGLFLNAASTLLLLHHSPDAKSETPKHVHMTTALCLLSFQLLSCVDKVHLRTSGQYTAFREFMMHCVDVINNVFTVLGATTSTHLSTHPRLFFLTTISMLLLFYLAHWQTFCNGVVKHQCFDINEVRSMVVLLHLCTSLSGHHVWEMPLLSNSISSNNSSNNSGGSYPMKFLPCCMSLLLGVLYAQRHLADILVQDGVGRNGSTIAGTSVLSPLVPVVCSLGMGVTVAKNSRIGILQQHPLPFTLLYSTTILKMTIQVIISHMSQSGMILVDPILIGPATQLIGQYFNCLDDYSLMILSLTYSTCYFSYFCLRIWIDIYNYHPPNPATSTPTTKQSSSSS